MPDERDDALERARSPTDATTRSSFRRRHVTTASRSRARSLRVRIAVTSSTSCRAVRDAPTRSSSSACRARSWSRATAIRVERESRIRMAERRRGSEIPTSLTYLAAPSGFEPPLTALRGRRPRPLDDGARTGLDSSSRSSGGGIRTPNYRTRTCRVADYTTPEWVSPATRCGRRRPQGDRGGVRV